MCLKGQGEMDKKSIDSEVGGRNSILYASLNARTETSMCIEHHLFYTRSHHQKILLNDRVDVPSRHEIFRTLASLRSLPVDVLGRNFDITSLAVDTTVVR